MHGCADCLELVAQDLGGPQRLPQSLPTLPAGDQRPGRGGVTPGRPEALPALRESRLVAGAVLLTECNTPRYRENHLPPVRWTDA